MPARHVRCFAVSLLLVTLLSAVPASAAPRGDDGGWDAPVAKIAQQFSRLIVRVLDTLTLPKP
jgi:hypothetical protein